MQGTTFTITISPPVNTRGAPRKHTTSSRTRTLSAFALQSETRAISGMPGIQSSLSGLIVYRFAFPPVNWWAILDTSRRDVPV